MSTTKWTKIDENSSKVENLKLIGEELLKNAVEIDKIPKLLTLMRESEGVDNEIYLYISSGKEEINSLIANTEDEQKINIYTSMNAITEHTESGESSNEEEKAPAIDLTEVLDKFEKLSKFQDQASAKKLFEAKYPKAKGFPSYEEMGTKSSKKSVTAVVVTPVGVVQEGNTSNDGTAKEENKPKKLSKPIVKTVEKKKEEPEKAAPVQVKSTAPKKTETKPITAGDVSKAIAAVVPTAAIPPAVSPAPPATEKVVKEEYIQVAETKFKKELFDALPPDSQAYFSEDSFKEFIKTIQRNKNNGKFESKDLIELDLPASKNDIKNMISTKVGKGSSITDIVTSYVVYNLMVKAVESGLAPSSWPALEWALKLPPTTSGKLSGGQRVYAMPGFPGEDENVAMEWEMEELISDHTTSERLGRLQKLKYANKYILGAEGRQKFLAYVQRLNTELALEISKAAKAASVPITSPPPAKPTGTTAPGGSAGPTTPGGSASSTTGTMPTASAPKNKRTRPDFGAALKKNIGRQTIRTNTGTVDIFQGAISGFVVMADMDVSKKIYDDRSMEPQFKICMYNLIGRDSMVITHEGQSTTVSGDTGRAYREQYNAVAKIEEFTSKSVKDPKKLSSLQSRANLARAKFANLYGRDMKAAEYLNAICGSSGEEAMRAVFSHMLQTKFFNINEVKPSNNVYWVLLEKNERLLALQTLITPIQKAVNEYTTGLATVTQVKDKTKLRSTMYSALRSLSNFPCLETFLIDTNYILSGDSTLAKSILVDNSFSDSCKIVKQCSKILFQGWEKVMAGRSSIRAIQFSFILVRQATSDTISINRTDLLDSISGDLPVSLSNEFKVKKP